MFSKVAGAGIRVLASAGTKAAGAGIKTFATTIVRPVFKIGKTITIDVIKDIAKDGLKEMIMNPATREKIINALVSGEASVQVTESGGAAGGYTVTVVSGGAAAAPSIIKVPVPIPAKDRFPAPCSCKVKPVSASPQGGEYRIYNCDMCAGKGATRVEYQRGLETVAALYRARDADELREAFFRHEELGPRGIKKLTEEEVSKLLVNAERTLPGVAAAAAAAKARINVEQMNAQLRLKDFMRRMGRKKSASATRSSSRRRRRTRSASGKLNRTYRASRGAASPRAAAAASPHAAAGGAGASGND